MKNEHSAYTLKGDGMRASHGGQVGRCPPPSRASFMVVCMPIETRNWMYDLTKMRSPVCEWGEGGGGGLIFFKNNRRRRKKKQIFSKIDGGNINKYGGSNNFNDLWWIWRWWCVWSCGYYCIEITTLLVGCQTRSCLWRLYHFYQGEYVILDVPHSE